MGMVQNSEHTNEWRLSIENQVTKQISDKPNSRFDLLHEVHMLCSFAISS